MVSADGNFMNASDEDIKGHNARLKRILKDSGKQSSKFIDTAKELGCDESEAAFNDKLKKLAKAQPEKPKKK